MGWDASQVVAFTSLPRASLATWPPPPPPTLQGRQAGNAGPGWVGCHGLGGRDPARRCRRRRSCSVEWPPQRPCPRHQTRGAARLPGRPPNRCAPGGHEEQRKGAGQADRGRAHGTGKQQVLRAGQGAATGSEAMCQRVGTGQAVSNRRSMPVGGLGPHHDVALVPVGHLAHNSCGAHDHAGRGAGCGCGGLELAGHHGLAAEGRLHPASSAFLDLRRQAEPETTFTGPGGGPRSPSPAKIAPYFTCTAAATLRIHVIHGGVWVFAPCLTRGTSAGDCLLSPAGLGPCVVVPEACWLDLVFCLAEMLAAAPQGPQSIRHRI